MRSAITLASALPRIQRGLGKGTGSARATQQHAQASRQSGERARLGSLMREPI